MSAQQQQALLTTNLPQTSSLKLVSRGKVRDIYEITDNDEGSEYLLFVATDRISAFDVVLKNGVPGKGVLLTQLSIFWFTRLSHIIPNHLVASTLASMPPGIRAQISPLWETHALEGRTLLVRKAKVVKLEAIVRGYLTGSAWNEYKKSGTVHGIPLPEGLVESSKLPSPLFTPSTKADQGQHDENISPQRAKEMIGEDLYAQIESAALSLFNSASSYALTRGLILADTKFEFGLLPSPPSASASPSSPPSPSTLILIDELLTPDSSRYWSLASYTPGIPQPSFDKQFLRDWLLSSGFRKGLEGGKEGRGEGWSMTEGVVRGTRERYEEVLRILCG